MADAVLLVARREVRAYRRTFLFWVVPVAALLVMVIAIEPSMAHQGSLLEIKLKMLPDALKRVFAIGSLDFTKPASYLALNFVYVTLTAALSAGMLGATLVAKEEAQRTAELLLTRPVARSRILLGKALALVLFVIGFHVVLGAVAIVGLAIVVKGDSDAVGIASLFAGTLALAICLGGAGMLIATLVARPRVAGNAALGVVLGGYLLDVVGAASPDLDFLSTISPFHWVEPSRIVSGGLDPIPLGVLVLAGVAAAALAIARYAHRDILT